MPTKLDIEFSSKIQKIIHNQKGLKKLAIDFLSNKDVLINENLESMFSFEKRYKMQLIKDLKLKLSIKKQTIFNNAFLDNTNLNDQGFKYVCNTVKSLINLKRLEIYIQHTKCSQAIIPNICESLKSKKTLLLFKMNCNEFKNLSLLDVVLKGLGMTQTLTGSRTMIEYKK